ncbi:MAG TPA: ABC transporter substrate-binding protein [Oligoflexia bacterium]|nr:ABC transporter substrate-binding protein [Oligoflexia bacterium]
MKQTAAILLSVIFLLNAGAAARADEDLLRIGALFPLTGKLASWGEQARSGAELAVERARKEKGVRIQVVVEDSAGDAKRAVTAAKRLIEVEKVGVLLAAERSSSTLALAPIAEHAKVILFSSAASADEISSAGDYVFRNRETGGAHARAMAEFLVRKGVKKAAVLAAISANSLTYAAVFKPHFSALGGLISHYGEYQDDAADFRTELVKAKNSAPQAFYLSPTTGQDAGVLVKQLRELGYDGLITGNVAIESEEFLRGAGAAAAGVHYTYPDYDAGAPGAREFSGVFRARFGTDPDIFAANTYDAVLIIAQGFAACRASMPDCLKDYLYSVKDYRGVGGNTSFDEHGDAVKPIIIKCVKDGKFQRAS